MSAPVDVLAVMRAICDRGLSNGRQWYDMPEATAAVAELIDFARASPCECLGPMPINTGATLPAAVCDRCKALTHAGVTP